MISGFLIWLTVIEPLAKKQQKILADKKAEIDNGNHDPDRVSLSMEKFFERNRLFTSKATLLRSLFVNGRRITFLWLLMIAIAYICEGLTCKIVWISIVVAVALGALLVLISWKILYEPLRKK